MKDELKNIEPLIEIGKPIELTDDQIRKLFSLSQTYLNALYSITNDENEFNHEDQIPEIIQWWNDGNTSLHCSPRANPEIHPLALSYNLREEVAYLADENKELRKKLKELEKAQRATKKTSKVSTHSKGEKVAKSPNPTAKNGK